MGYSQDGSVMVPQIFISVLGPTVVAIDGNVLQFKLKMHYDLLQSFESVPVATHNETSIAKRKKNWSFF